MRQITQILFAFSLFISLTGCGSGGPLGRSVDSIQMGSNREEVRAALGEPDARLHSRVGNAHLADPNKKVGAVMPSGTVFDVWVYRREKSEYRLYFASDTGKPSEEWPLVARETVPWDGIIR